MEILLKPWPWYVTGPLLGLSVPLLLLMGNKRLNISSSLRHICAAVLPSSISLFRYNWKREIWNFYFVDGILIGGWMGGFLLSDPDSMTLSPQTRSYLRGLGLSDFTGLMPTELFNVATLNSVKGFCLMVVGGFLIGFGTRYARGCTSGHGMVGLSAFQWPSAVATLSFFIGGFLASRFVLPYILSL